MSERVRGAAGGATAGSLASILPDDVEVEEAIHLSSVGLLADEEPFVARFAPRRLAEFVSGRACARRALVALGVPDALRRAIPVGAHGQPVWPAGVVGSITHCPGRCAAVAAPSDRYRSIGIDNEVPDASSSGGHRFHRTSLRTRRPRQRL
jgi:4'-phosphopantetheinyl transferase EntD